MRLSPLAIKRLFSDSTPLISKNPGITPYFIGALGLTPFVASTVGIYYFPSSLDQLLYLQSLYGCSILSFLGAVHWGILFSNPCSKKYIAGVVPMLVGFSSCLVPHVPVTLMIQGIGFLGLYAYERRLYKANFIPKWYINLRFGLTGIVVTSLTTSIVLDYLQNS